ncbi:MAG: metallophosphoesterase family protein [Bacteroidales bacterium]
MIIGLISDTHGLVRPDVHRALAGVDLILHAGDVGSLAVLSELETIAPVEAVAGNVDALDLMLPPAFAFDVGTTSVHVSHGNEVGSSTPENLALKYPSFDVIIFGHTHKAVVRRVGNVLVINPGAAGPRRFNLTPSVGRLVIEDGQPSVEIVDLAL